ncbi:MAG TPA: hypothetical protein VI758_07740 [Bacteroidota bacterium]
MAKSETFSRRISSEEAKKGYVFILKDKLSFFPPVGKPFDLHSLKTEKKSSVESYHCTCRGPQLPHDHYFLRWEGLRFGDKVSIEKDEKAENMYELSVGR